jgi:hypothetical protein
LTHINQRHYFWAFFSPHSPQLQTKTSYTHGEIIFKPQMWYNAL